MLKRIVIILVGTAVLMAGLMSCQQKPLTQDELLVMLDSLEYKFEWMDYRIALEEWQYYTTGQSDSLEFYNRLYNSVITDRRIFDALRTGQTLLSDEVDLRRWAILNAAVVGAAVETDPDITHLRDSLSSVNIAYRADFEGNKCTDAYLYNLYRSEPNPTRREAAFRALNSVGDSISVGLERLFPMRNQAATRLGYSNYFAMSFDLQNINVDNYLSLLKELDSLSLKPYRDILSRARLGLGVDNLEVWDLAYAYNDINSEIRKYFPVDSQMIYVSSSLKAIGFDLNKMPIYFDLESREGKSQFAYEFDIKPPHDMRVLGNLTEGILSTQVLMHEIGHALHSASVVQDRSLFVNHIDGSWAEAMAQIMAALLDNKDWLTKYAHVPEDLAIRYLAARHDGEIIYLRQRLAWLYFEYEAYVDPNRDLNRLYWDLFAKYCLLPRHDDIKSWAAVIHFTTHPVYLQNYLFGDIVAAQTMSFIDATYGSPVDNPMTRSFLIQSYYRFGGRYDWRELLKRGLDQELNPDYLIKRMGL